ncbi:MAG: efflux RND transporter periplasmic adaptor subunit, partial [Immundisolibacteraceae bacterium]|nr:efflux RND transporter periplasmic adaptor subunit [Immundisolibacteraceae bacterium]
ALQDEEAGLKALQRQLSTAEANADIAARNLEKTSVLAPVSGQVQQRAITVGSYVKKGDLAFQVSNSEQLTIHLPFPEKVLQHLRPGQQVYLETPSSNQRVIDGTISQLLPMVEPTSRAGEAIIDITNPGDWFPGASVSGEVVLDSRHSVVVPKVALVIRPAGKTVYVIKDQIARQRIVTIGEYLDDQVEVLKGLEIGEIIAVEGAAYLSDGAPIKTPGSKPANTNSASPKAKQ